MWRCWLSGWRPRVRTAGKRRLPAAPCCTLPASAAALESGTVLWSWRKPLPFRTGLKKPPICSPTRNAFAEEWDISTYGHSVRTAAGIAAAGAGDFTRSEQHHRAAIARMDACGYKLGAAIARIRYADVLLMRRAAGDASVAHGLLEIALAQCEAMRLELYAQVARKRLAESWT